MFDTNFFINTYEAKKDLTTKGIDPSSRREIIEHFNANLRKFPLVYNLESTNYCNMKCIMCQRTTDLTRPLKHMDDRTFAAVLEQIVPLSDTEYQQWQAFVDTRLRTSREPSENNFYYDVITRCLTLHGFGEPLLDPALPDRVEALRRKNIPVYFSCNPCNIRLDVMRDLFKAGTGYIKFAMDSLDDRKAREIRGGAADFTESYQRILETLALKAEMNANTEIILTMLDLGGDSSLDSEASRFLDLWKDKDVFAYVKTVDNRWLLKRKSQSEMAKGEEQNHYSGQYCEYPWTTLTILADGELVPCMQDVNATWSLGNIKTHSLQEVWHGKKMKELRRFHVLGGYDASFFCHAKCDWKIVDYFVRNV